MPDARLKRPCSFTQCGGYAQDGSTFCEAHQKQGARARIWNKRLVPSNRIFRWMRKAYLAQHPICNQCKREAASILDHVIPHRGINALFWDQSNWQALCLRCHGIKTAHETRAIPD